MARRILVTGASGFVGSHLMPMLAASEPGAEILPGSFDLTDAAAVRAALARARPAT